LSESLELSDREPLRRYQLRVVQEVLLALLAQSGAHAYELRARLALALGPLAEALNEGQVYVTVGRLEKSGLDVAAGESVAIVGPSGCGKSMLLYLLGGLERPTAGSLRLADRRLERLPEAQLARLRRHALGFVFQSFHLVDELTATENVELPMLLAGRSPHQARKRAGELLRGVGLADRAGHLPSALSGGQRQRVAIARALANEPAVVLADEPTGNLDSEATTEVLRLFEQLRADGQTLVLVTHDERVAATADRLLTMRDGVLVDETRLTGGSAWSLGAITGLEE
jgi:putative ABC transport system ATP-binding protein